MDAPLDEKIIEPPLSTCNPPQPIRGAHGWDVSEIPVFDSPSVDASIFGSIVGRTAIRYLTRLRSVSETYPSASEDMRLDVRTMRGR